MTRDILAYKYYANFTKNSYNGIDNVFFVNLLNLPQIDTDLTPYVVLNIEEPKHYRIKEELKNIFKEKNIVYSYHKPFPYTKVSKLVKNGVIIQWIIYSFTGMLQKFILIEYMLVSLLWHLEIKQDCLAIVLG